MNGKSFRFAIMPLLLCVLPCGPANADYSSEVTLEARGFFDPLAAGGIGFGSVYASDAGTIVGDEFWRGMYGESAASAEDGELSLGMFGSVWTGNATERNGHGGGASRTRDAFAIGPGSSGLDNGEPAQILVQVRLDGRIALARRPNGIAVDLDVTVAATSLVEYWAGDLVPPVDLEVHELWEFAVDTTIGAAVPVEADLRAGVLGADFGPDEVGRNFAHFDALVRVTTAPGFEDISLASEAGAPTTSIPTANDFDGDGIDDSLDNCIGAFNPGQQDTNGNNIGNACDPDIALPANCFVNFADLMHLSAAFFSEPGDLTWNPDADFNSDARVNFTDLQIMKDHFFDAPGASGLANACMPVLLASGAFTLNAGMAFDLDTGTETAVSDPAADIAWSVLSPPHNIFFAPLNGARIDDYGSAEPNVGDCRLAEPTDAPVPFAVTTIGTYLCARTGEGRIGRFQISGATSTLLQTATTMDIAFAVWD